MDERENAKIPVSSKSILYIPGCCCRFGIILQQKRMKFREDALLGKEYSRDLRASKADVERIASNKGGCRENCEQEKARKKRVMLRGISM